MRLAIYGIGCIAMGAAAAPLFFAIQ